MEKYEFNDNDLDKFFESYRECALWALLDDEGEPLDNEYSDEDYSIECHNEMLNDCKNFLGNYGILIRRVMRTHNYTLEQAGHDYWLTRNHHGAGYWDRGLGKIGQWLTDFAHMEGSVDLYVGDDGLIYQV